jgi:hypothetical protein
MPPRVHKVPPFLVSPGAAHNEHRPPRAEAL